MEPIYKLHSLLKRNMKTCHINADSKEIYIVMENRGLEYKVYSLTKNKFINENHSIIEMYLEEI